MSTYQPSHQMQREIEGKLRGERVTHGPGTAAAAKRSLDAATKEYEQFKLDQARQRRAEGAPERLTQAREAIGGARTQREVEAAFEAARRSLKR